MVCKNCGKEISDNAKFCSGCGSVVEKDVFCLKCGNPLKSEAKFCSKCGSNLQTAEYSLKKNNDTIFHLILETVFLAILFLDGLFKFAANVSYGSMSLVDDNKMLGNYKHLLVGLGDDLRSVVYITAIALAVITILFTILNIKNKRKYSKKNYIVGLILLIFYFISILIGIVSFNSGNVGTGNVSGSREFVAFCILFYIQCLAIIFDLILYKRNKKGKFLLSKREDN